MHAWRGQSLASVLVFALGANQHPELEKKPLPQGNLIQNVPGEFRIFPHIISVIKAHLVRLKYVSDRERPDTSIIGHHASPDIA